MDRRIFNIGLAATGVGALLGRADARRRGMRTTLYASVGNRITRYDVDVDAATLTAHESITLPSVVQYAWPHPSGHYLYASTSDAIGGSRTPTGSIHRLCALKIGADGALAMHGSPQVLAQRPIHNSLDHTGRWALTAYNTIADMTVHPVNPDGTLGAQVVQRTAVDHGIFPHQVRATPSDRSVVLVTRGNSGGADRPEDPGALELYRFRDGQVSPLATLKVGGRGGLGYGPRHLDFHPRKPWAYVAIERQNQLHMHILEGDGLSAEPLFVKTALAGQAQPGVPQVVGTVHVHPRGHVAYVANRASGTVDHGGRPVWRGGENSIAVFALDPATGEPRLIQSADTQGFHPRAFAVDPSGRLLVAANLIGMSVRDGDIVREVPASLALFRIADDGRLTFVRKYDVALAPGEQQAWVAMLARAA